MSDLDDAAMVDAMLLITADEMFWAIRDALAGHDWFDCWASINEASAVAVQAILKVGPPPFLLEPASLGWFKTNPEDEVS